MSTKKEELVAIAREGGYEGDMPSTIAEAISAVGSVAGGGSSGGGSDYVAIAGFAGTGAEMADKCEFGQETASYGSFPYILVPMVDDTLPSLVDEGCVVSITTTVKDSGVLVTRSNTAKLMADQHVYWVTAVGATFNSSPFYYGYVKSGNGLCLNIPSIPMSSSVDVVKQWVRENVLYVQISVIPASVADAIAGEQSSAPEPMIVHFTRDNDKLVADQKFDNIAKAYSSGALVFGVKGTFFTTDKYPFPNGFVATLQLTDYEVTNEPGVVPYVEFTRLYFNGTAASVHTIKCSRTYADVMTIEETYRPASS